MTTKLIGVISDTHGLIRKEAVQALAGTDLIIHAGDIGEPAVLAELVKIAPVTAVKGNVDNGEWAQHLPWVKLLEFEGVYVHIIHELGKLVLHPQKTTADMIISGHSHRPILKTINGVLYLNPGSAGPRRFNLPVSVAILTITDHGIEVEIKRLKEQAGFF